MSTQLPDGPLGQQVRWVLARLEPGTQPLTPQAARARFSKDFLAQLPPAKLDQTFVELRALGPFTVVEAAPVLSQGELRTVALRLLGAEPVVMELALDRAGRIAGLFFKPDTSGQPPADYDSLDDMVQDLGALGEVQVYAGVVAADGCRAIHQEPATAVPAPSGSVFKLVVLSAVADAVGAGELSWDHRLTITDRVRSLPAGELQDRPAGSRVSVRRAARLMISRSDNTAADLLVSAVGHDRVQGTVDALGISDRSMRPMLTTREFFLLGWGAPGARQAWSAAGPRERAALLAALPDSLSAVPATAVDTPVWQAGVGWFLTGDEVCRTYARLLEQASTSTGEPLRGVLELEGAEVPGAEYVASKGGSAPGVLALSHLVDRGADDPRVLVVQVRRRSGAVDQEAVAAAVEGGLAVLADDR